MEFILGFIVESVISCYVLFWDVLLSISFLLSFQSVISGVMIELVGDCGDVAEWQTRWT